jgi:hypothetical protein
MDHCRTWYLFKPDLEIELAQLTLKRETKAFGRGPWSESVRPGPNCDIDNLFLRMGWVWKQSSEKLPRKAFRQQFW